MGDIVRVQTHQVFAGGLTTLLRLAGGTRRPIRELQSSVVLSARSPNTSAAAPPTTTRTPLRCATPGPVAPGGSAGPQGSTYPGDWKTIEKLSSFVGSATPPFFGFVGTNILHPPYQTNDYWFSRANTTALPQWAPLTSLHPCDLQVSIALRVDRWIAQ